MEKNLLFEALPKARAEFPDIKRTKQVTVVTKTGGKYNFHYAPLDEILKAVTPALSKNGLSISQFREDNFLVTQLSHMSGGFIQSKTPLPPIQNPQEYGSFLTYMRRYDVSMILGIAAEEDNDANEVSTTHTKSFQTQSMIMQEKKPIPPSPKQLEYIKKLCIQLNIEMPILRNSEEASKFIAELTNKHRTNVKAQQEQRPFATTEDIPF